MSGDATITNAGALTLKNTGTAGTYGQVTTDAQGRVTAGATCDVSHGGTGDTSLTAYAVLCGGTTSTGAVQSVSGVGTSGQVLTSNGASALPTWQAGGGGGGTVIPNTYNFRLTLQSGHPVPNTDQVGKSIVYMSPYNGGYIATYDSSTWTYHSSGEISVTLSGLTSGKNYDVVAYFISSTLKIDLMPAWTNDTTRANAISTQDGVWTNTLSFTSVINGDSVGAHAGRYLGTLRTTGTTTTEWSTKVIGSGGSPASTAKQFLWNVTNQIETEIAVIEGTSTWAGVANATWGTFNGSNNNRFECVVGLDALTPMEMNVYAGVILGAQAYAAVGLQVDGTGGGAASNQADSGFRCGVDTQALTEQLQVPLAAYFKSRVPLGYHFYQALQWDITQIVTFIGTDTSSNSRRAGIVGFIIS